MATLKNKRMIADTYLSLLKKSLVSFLNTNISSDVVNAGSKKAAFSKKVLEHYTRGDVKTFHTLRRLNGIEKIIKNIISKNIEGDIVECGVWKGGGMVFFHEVVRIFEKENRKRHIWGFDSFEGLPKPGNPKDATLYKMKTFNFKVKKKEVVDLFKRYEVDDAYMHLVPGWFKNTLCKTKSEIKKISLLIIDCDYFDSTETILKQLYENVCAGGFVIVDDYHLDDICGEKKAVDMFRLENNISSPLVKIDWQSSYWIKS